MSYTAEISRVNPSCFLFLIDQSGSMEEPIGGTTGKRKSDSVADAINRLLQNLVIKCTKSEGIRDYYELGVIGYGAKTGFAFGGTMAGQSLVSISEVAKSPIRIEERIKKVDDGAGGLVDQKVKFPIWFEPIAYGGTPMCEAISLAHRSLKGWVSQHQSSYPPIVINITDGESTDGNPSSQAQELSKLSVADGNLLLFNCHISSQTVSPIAFPDTEVNLPDEYATMLFRMSSVLPENLREAASGEGFNVGEQARGFVLNADLVELIRFLDIGTRPSNLR